ncbi:hypothetical protein [Polaribacter sp. SA4-12]|uniref:hypothetical protein n=1 Tax=Polaribacter sp. SA4-12 TaxID=1312072 RepID=UPI0012F72C8F|nr:hypothetical protein [Polaribacter sp. SA4-12]
MKKGVIIIFGKNDLTISKNLSFKSSFSKKVKICLVNNGNDTKGLNFLYKLKESSKCDVSILNLRKEKESMLAVKAGVRFLTNTEDINIFVYANPKNILDKNLIKKILKISDEDLENKDDERVLLRRVYSFDELINC